MAEIVLISGKASNIFENMVIAVDEEESSVRQYITIEAKRLITTLPGFLLAVFSTLLLAILTVFLAEKFMPEALEVKPFRVGVCVESEDLTASYVREYIEQMDSTEKLIEFVEMQRWEIETALQEKNLTACIVIPDRTAESIMDGTNIPIRVIMGAGVDNTERYLQQRLLTLLTECGAALIDVPQVETLLLYEMQIDNPEEMGRILDLFHFGLVIDRENWFETETVSAFGSVDIEKYYLAAGLALFLLFWGIGSGSFFRGQEKNLPLLLERKGIPLIFQQGVKQLLFFMLYLAPILLLSVGTKSIKAAISLLFCGMMLSLQCCFFFELAPTVASGMVMNSVWGFAGFLGAGGMMPAVFLPKLLIEICSRLPAGICLEIFLQSVDGRKGSGGKAIGLCLLWCLIFGTAGQLVFCGKQRRKVRK